jgi:hypothetical protein
MLIKVVTKNKDGKIELTEEELRKVLDEAYWEGYNNKQSNTITWTSPQWWEQQPYYTITTASSNVTIRSPEIDEYINSK